MDVRVYNTFCGWTSLWCVYNPCDWSIQRLKNSTKYLHGSIFTELVLNRNKSKGLIFKAEEVLRKRLDPFLRRCQHIDCIASNCATVGERWIGKGFEGSGRGLLEILLRQLPEGPEWNQEVHRWGYRVFRPRFEPSISPRQIKSITTTSVCSIIESLNFSFTCILGEKRLSEWCRTDWVSRALYSW
jgi:hypothetical protein